VTTVKESITDLKQFLQPLRPATLGLVPTMGALHAGHAQLIEAARRECETVVVTIFVNPLQFDRPDDLHNYPRVLEKDIEMCSHLGVDIVFAPAEAEMYPALPLCTVEVSRIGDHLCGRYRPGHFRGVATVVLKLFDIVQPGKAYFGEKDAQQLAIIRRMVSDFNLPVTIVEIPTVRESDGLAVSSRNAQLSVEERRLAPTLYRALCEARDQISRGERNAETIKRAALQRIPAGTKLEYLEVVDPNEMQPVEPSVLEHVSL
jgi:pantoate--beta-alanine ligase